MGQASQSTTSFLPNKRVILPGATRTVRLHHGQRANPSPLPEVTGGLETLSHGPRRAKNGHMGAAKRTAGRLVFNGFIMGANEKPD